MLPPFKIRQLRLHNPLEPAQEARVQIVQISSSDYDDTISRYPEATLSYVDEDDGELMTVGSSLELQQRLDEPVVPPPTLSTSPSMHIFDLATRQEDTFEIWVKFAKESRFSHSFSPCLPFSQGKNVQCSITSVDDQRRRHFLATRPPQPAVERALGQSESDRLFCQDLSMVKQARFREECGARATPALEDQLSPLKASEKSHSILTNEGTRQAQDAGAKLRCSLKSFDSINKSKLQPQKVAHQNRWASYGRASPGIPEWSRSQDQRLSATAKPSLRTEDGEASGTEAIRGNDCFLRPTLAMKDVGPSEPTTAVQKLSGNAKGEVTQISQPQKPLLEAFEAEIAGLAQSSPQEPLTDATEATDINQAENSASSVRSPTLSTTPQSSASDTSSSHRETLSGISSPADVFTHTICSFVEGVGLLASDIRNIFPEAPDQVGAAQEQLPQAVENILQGVFKGFGEHVQSFANFVQEAAISTGNLADQTVQSETEVLVSATEGLRSLALGVREVSRELFAAAPPRPTVSQGLANCESTAATSESAASMDENRSQGGAVHDSSCPTKETIAAPVQNHEIEIKNRPSEALQQEISRSSQEDATSAIEQSISTNLKVPLRDSGLEASPTIAVENITKSQKHEVLPLSAPIDAHSLSALNSANTLDRYENIHRKKREHAAERREVGKGVIMKDLAGREVRDFSSRFSYHLRYKNEDPDGVAKSVNMDDGASLVLASPSDKHPESLDSPATAASNSDLLSSQSLPSRHNISDRIQFRRHPDSTQGRCPRKSLSKPSLRLPYEYIVPPSGYDRQTTREDEPTASVSEQYDNRKWSKSPPSRRNTYCSSPRRPSSGWSQFPRHGPIYLPHDPSSTYSMPQSSKALQFDQADGFRRSDPVTHCGPQLATPERSGEEVQYQRASENCPSQAWHPRSYVRTVGSPLTTHCANSTEEALPPSTQASGPVNLLDMGEPGHDQQSAAAPERKSSVRTHARPSTGDRSCASRDWIQQEGPRGVSPASSAAEGTMLHRAAGFSQILTNPKESSRTKALEALNRANTVSASRPYRVPLPFPVRCPVSSDKWIQPTNIPKVMQPPSLPRVEKGPSTFRNSSPFPHLPCMDGLTLDHPSGCSSERERSSVPSATFPSAQTSSNASIVRPGSNVLDIQTAFEQMPNLSIEEEFEAKSFESDLSAGMKSLPARPAGLGTPEPGARLAGPFDPLDPLAESVSLHRNGLGFNRGIRRSATERQQRVDCFALTGRSHPRNHHGSFLGDWSNDFSRFAAQGERTRGKITDAPRADAKVAQNQRVDSINYHEDTTTVCKVQECVDQLKTLGFGTEDDGGVGRLVIYAQAADGDLEGAMEIIEEERKAYQQSGMREFR